MITQFELVLNWLLCLIFFYLANQEKNQRSVYKFLERFLFYHDQYLITEMDFAIVEKWKKLATEY